MTDNPIKMHKNKLSNCFTDKKKKINQIQNGKSDRFSQALSFKLHYNCVVEADPELTLH